jgi:hypothetical protein
VEYICCHGIDARSYEQAYTDWQHRAKEDVLERKMRVLEKDIEEKNRLVSDGHARLLNTRRIGIDILDVRGRGLHQCVTQSVVGGGSAERAGINVGDVITEVNGHIIHTRADFSKAVEALAAGERVTFGLLRKNEQLATKLEVGSSEMNSDQIRQLKVDMGKWSHQLRAGMIPELNDLKQKKRAMMEEHKQALQNYEPSAGPVIGLHRGLTGLGNIHVSASMDLPSNHIHNKPELLQSVSVGPAHRRLSIRSNTTVGIGLGGNTNVIVPPLVSSQSAGRLALGTSSGGHTTPHNVPPIGGLSNLAGLVNANGGNAILPGTSLGGIGVGSLVGGIHGVVGSPILVGIPGGPPARTASFVRGSLTRGFNGFPGAHMLGTQPRSGSAHAVTMLRPSPMGDPVAAAAALQALMAPPSTNSSSASTPTEASMASFNNRMSLGPPGGPPPLNHMQSTESQPHPLLLRHRQLQQAQQAMGGPQASSAPVAAAGPAPTTSSASSSTPAVAMMAKQGSAVSLEQTREGRGDVRTVMRRRSDTVDEEGEVEGAPIEPSGHVLTTSTGERGDIVKLPQREPAPLHPIHASSHDLNDPRDQRDPRTALLRVRSVSKRGVHLLS